MEESNIISPFVVKTYQMVSDPTTENIIRWGRSNNSFIVVDVFEFSDRILPAYFKHGNFSSFVRQLNTYGFKKVDPDRWEFANEWFLRGQTHLLNRITRKKHRTISNPSNRNHYQEDDDDRDIITEIEKLKQEQRAFDEELESMNKRLEITEKRPQQVMSFLYQVVEDPEIISKMANQSQRNKRLVTSEKKRRLVEETGEGIETGVNSSFQHAVSPEKWSPGWFDQRPLMVRPLISQEPYGCGYLDDSFPADFVAGGGGFAADPMAVKGVYGCFGGGEVGMEEARPPGYPFSLLGGDFY